eukprot:GHVR01011712.1.p1 GENE.GHVR01011712.1~~GHVR01011712.1.p1  ORF type:complete len:205 (-),score=71.71 GHVR01011712.1:615-1229(-)
MPARHSKNNCAGAVFTFHERENMENRGSVKERLGAESMRSFECCWLCLKTAQRPCVTPAGYIYCRQCILLCFKKQKEQYDAKHDAWQRQQIIINIEDDKSNKLAEEEAVTRFIELHDTVPSRTSNDTHTHTHTHTRTHNEDTITGGNKRKFVDLDKQESKKKNFWIPDTVPSAASAPKKEPKKHTHTHTYVYIRIYEYVHMRIR